MVSTWDYPDAVRAFVENGLWGGAEQFSPDTQALGFVRGGEGLVAGMIYHNWSPRHGTIELSGFSTRRDWMTRTNLSQIIGYPFDDAGVRLLIGRTSEHNAPARRIWRALGSKEYLIPDVRAEGEGEVFYTLSQQQWRTFIKKGHPNG